MGLIQWKIELLRGERKQQEKGTLTVSLSKYSSRSYIDRIDAFLEFQILTELP